jgi:gliding motility-associated-like protein
VTPSYPICEGSNEQLFASASDSVGYKWTPSVGLSNANIPNPFASPADSTIYKVLITNKYGCKDSAYLPVDVYRKPNANAGPDKVILIGDTANLNATIKGTSVNFFWTPSAFINNVNVINPVVSPPQSSAYTLHVVSTVGCGVASDNVLVKVYKDFYIPNAFTPNNDGKNDKFEIPALDNYKLLSLIIYNRWGQVVFKSKGAFAAWDGYRNGIIQIQGIYVYYVEIQAPNGRKITRKGSIMLLR